jgi:hypothetical protein
MKGSRSDFRKFAATALRSHEGEAAFNVVLTNRKECEALAKEFYFIGCKVEVFPAETALSVAVPASLDGPDLPEMRVSVM